MIYRLNERGEVVQISFSNHSRDREQTCCRLTLDEVDSFYRALKAFYDLLYAPDNLIEYKLSEGRPISNSPLLPKGVTSEAPVFLTNNFGLNFRGMLWSDPTQTPNMHYGENRLKTSRLYNTEI